jgi:hypothetical protein
MIAGHGHEWPGYGAAPGEPGFGGNTVDWLVALVGM